MNNCIGYRNHKFFLLFLVFFSIYMICILTHSIFSMCLIITNEFISESADKGEFTIKVLLNLFIVIVVIVHAPVLCLQNYSQVKKLKQQQHEIEAVEDDATTEVSIDHDRNVEERSRKSKCICCSNFGALWSYRPQSQDYLYRQLFGEDPEVKSPGLNLKIGQVLSPIDEISSNAETSKFPIGS